MPVATNHHTSDRLRTGDTSQGVLITELNHTHDGASPTRINNPYPERHFKKHHKKPTHQVLRVDEEVFEWRGQEHSCPLPNNIPINQLVDEVGRSLTFSSVKQHRDWTRRFQSPAVKALCEDMFWWIVCDKYGCGKDEDKALLFDRIASNYAGLVFAPRSQGKDVLMSKLWDAIAQFTFHAITLAYPKSSTMFDHRLKNTLIDTFSEWTTGLRPTNATCDHWRLTPGKRPKNQGKNKLAMLQSSTPHGSVMAPVANARHRAMIGTRERGTNLGRGGKAATHSFHKRSQKSTPDTLGGRRKQTKSVAVELAVKQSQMHKSTPLFHLKPESVVVTESLGHSMLMEHFLRSKHVHLTVGNKVSLPFTQFADRPMRTLGGHPETRRPRRKVFGPALRQIRMTGSTSKDKVNDADDDDDDDFEVNDYTDPLVAGYAGRGGNGLNISATEVTKKPKHAKLCTYADVAEIANEHRTGYMSVFRREKKVMRQSLAKIAQLTRHEQQVLAKTRTSALRGDVHEYSNFLVSTWAIENEK